VFNSCTQKANFEDKCWQIVVQKERPIDEKVWRKVDYVSEQEGKSNVFKFHPFLVAQINDLSTTS
jgi:hypothetical protein